MKEFYEVVNALYSIISFLKRKDKVIIGLNMELDDARVNIDILKAMLEDAGIDLSIPVRGAQHAESEESSEEDV